MKPTVHLQCDLSVSFNSFKQYFGKVKVGSDPIEALYVREVLELPIGDGGPPVIVQSDAMYSWRQGFTF